MHITFIQTGGTIDKDYPRGKNHHGYAFLIGEPAVKKILDTHHVRFSYEILTLFKKDSLDITDSDRTKLVRSVVRTKNAKIIITHGTDTLLKTAEALSNIQGKTIVLTGAMLPAKFAESDAAFNIGMAVAGVQSLPPGIYIALSGVIVPWKQYTNRK
ncbi:MAG: asparaginase domain-containing protein [Minisyncoccia bacterium]